MHVTPTHRRTLLRVCGTRLIAAVMCLATPGVMGATPVQAATCFPDCRAGFVCDVTNGQCVSRCNPICANGERCTQDRLCLPIAPMLTPQTRTSPPQPPPSTTAWPAADNGVRVPRGRHQRPVVNPGGTLASRLRLDIEVDSDGGAYVSDTDEFETEVTPRLYFALDYAFTDRVDLGIALLNPFEFDPIEVAPPLLYTNISFTAGPGLVQAGVRAEVLFPFEDIFGLSLSFPVRLGDDLVQMRLTPWLSLNAPTGGGETQDPWLNIGLDTMLTFAAGDVFYAGLFHRLLATDVGGDDVVDDVLVAMKLGLELGGTISAPAGNVDLFGQLTIADFWNSKREEVRGEVIVISIGVRAFNGFL